MDNPTTKDELLERLYLFASCPDDDNILFKEKIKDAFMNCPELLYAIHEKSLEKELFNLDGTINYDGEWDKYFSDGYHDGNIRPYLFLPEAQAESRNYVCYQVHFNEVPRYNGTEKYAVITFTIFVHEGDTIDFGTGIPRHDLIAAIIRDRLNWTNIFGMQCHVTANRESTTDYQYVVRTIDFTITMPNNITQTIIRNDGGTKKYSTNTINNLGRM